MAETVIAVKTAATQRSVDFIFTSANTGTWKVYSASSGGTALSNVTAAYYVSVTETGKTESERLGLQVQAYNAPALGGTVTITGTVKVIH